MQKWNNNDTVKCISCCIRCVLDCCHRFIKFLNKNAYIQVALTGDDFCTSAMVAFTLALKNAVSFFITNGVSGIIAVLGKCFISVMNTVIIREIMLKNEEIDAMTTNEYPALLVIFIGTWFTASIVMSVFQMTSLTILQCLFADCDICDQLGQDKFWSTNRPSEMEDLILTLKKD